MREPGAHGRRGCPPRARLPAVRSGRSRVPGDRKSRLRSGGTSEYGGYVTAQRGSRDRVEAPIVTHTYQAPGTYEAILTAADERDLVDTDTLNIFARPPPAVPTTLSRSTCCCRACSSAWASPCSD
jgi:hypothetical protein